MKPNIVNIFQYGKEKIINMFGALVHFIQQNSKFLRTKCSFNIQLSLRAEQEKFKYS